MDARNIAMVRSTNVIPFDGEVKPLNEVPYLREDNNSELAKEIKRRLIRKGIIQRADLAQTDEEREQMEEKNRNEMKKYVPYGSTYNSMLAWSLNGLVPDDMNNRFSNKTCAIIDGLEEQLDEADFISLVPTDTAVKGRVKISKNASILISKDRYDGLSVDQKEQLANLGINIEVFEGTLKEAVNQNLANSGRYTAETLALYSNGVCGYMQSDTSQDLLTAINNVAKERGIPQVLNQNVLNHDNEDIDKLGRVANEYQRMSSVQQFYRRKFIEFLATKMEISEDTKDLAMYMPDASTYIENLVDEISDIGLDEYSQAVEIYNKSLKHMQGNKTLPTPEQIATAIERGEDIDLVSMIDEASKQLTLRERITVEGIDSSGIIQTENGDNQLDKGEER